MLKWRDFGSVYIYKNRLSDKLLGTSGVKTAQNFKLCSRPTEITIAKSNDSATHIV